MDDESLYEYAKYLDEKPKVGEKLSAEQAKAIQGFFAFVKHGLDSDEFGIFADIKLRLHNIGVDLDRLYTERLLTDKEKEEINLFYFELRKLIEEKEYSLNIPSNVQFIVLEQCRETLEALDESSAEYKAYEEKEAEEFYRLTEVNRAEAQKLVERGVSASEIVIRILTEAITNKNNYRVTAGIDHFRIIFGASAFDRLIEEYSLNKDELTLDEVRMLIVGAFANTVNLNEQGKFLTHLAYAFEVNLDSPNAKFELSKKVSDLLVDSELGFASALKRLAEQPPTKLFDRCVNHLRSWLPEQYRKWLVDERFKANGKFNNDLALVNTICSASNWRVKSDSKKDPAIHEIEQRAAADEYLFHKLAYFDTSDGAIVPVVENDGRIKHYKIKSLANETGFKAKVLLPCDPSCAPLDVKVLFRGTSDIGSAIVDAEGYGAAHDTYREHETTILNGLDAAVAELKAEAAKNGNLNAEVSLTAGGHSLGGALAQNFAWSMAKVKFEQTFQNYRDKPEMVQRDLLPQIIEQINYEISQGFNKNISIEDKAKIASLAEKRLAELWQEQERFAQAHLAISEQEAATSEASERQPIQLKTGNLAEIYAARFTMLNSAGVALGTRHEVVDRMGILTAQRVNPDFSFDHLMVGGDIVQQTGQANVTSAAPASSMQVRLVKIDAGYEGKAKLSLLKGAGFAVANVLSKRFFGFDLPLVAGAAASDLIIEAYNSLVKSHTEVHFSDPSKPAKYEFFSNASQGSAQQLYELTKKIPIVNSEWYQNVKRYISWPMNTIAKIYDEALQREGDLEQYLRSGFEQVANFIGKDNLLAASNLAGLNQADEILTDEKQYLPELDFTSETGFARGTEPASKSGAMSESRSISRPSYVRESSTTSEPGSTRKLPTSDSLMKDTRTAISATDFNPISAGRVAPPVPTPMLADSRIRINQRNVEKNKWLNYCASPAGAGWDKIKAKDSELVEFVSLSKDKPSQRETKFVATFSGQTEKAEFKAITSNIDENVVLKMLQEAQKLGKDLVLSGADLHLIQVAIEVAVNNDITNIRLASETKKQFEDSQEQAASYKSSLQLLEQVNKLKRK